MDAIRKRHNWPDELVENWKTQGLHVEPWTAKPGESWSDEGHDGDEFIYVLTGQLVVKLTTGVLLPSGGEYVRIPRNTPHTVSNPAAVPVDIIWAHDYDYARVSS